MIGKRQTLVQRSHWWRRIAAALVIGARRCASTTLLVEHMAMRHALCAFVLCALLAANVAFQPHVGDPALPV